MPKAGLEPARPFEHYPLKIACLPDSTTSAWHNYSLSIRLSSGNDTGKGSSAAGATFSLALSRTIELDDDCDGTLTIEIKIANNKNNVAAR